MKKEAGSRTSSRLPLGEICDLLPLQNKGVF